MLEAKLSSKSSKSRKSSKKKRNQKKEQSDKGVGDQLEPKSDQPVRNQTSENCILGEEIKDIPQMQIRNTEEGLIISAVYNDNVQVLQSGKYAKTPHKFKMLDGVGILHLASYFGAYKIIKFLLDDAKFKGKFNVNKDVTLSGKNATWFALKWHGEPGFPSIRDQLGLQSYVDSKFEVFKFLVSKGIDLNSVIKSPVSSSETGGKLEGVWDLFFDLYFCFKTKKLENKTVPYLKILLDWDKNHDSSPTIAAKNCQTNIEHFRRLLSFKNTYSLVFLDKVLEILALYIQNLVIKRDECKKTYKEMQQDEKNTALEAENFLLKSQLDDYDASRSKIKAETEDLSKALLQKNAKISVLGLKITELENSIQEASENLESRLLLKDEDFQVLKRENDHLWEDYDALLTKDEKNIEKIVSLEKTNKTQIADLAKRATKEEELEGIILKFKEDQYKILDANKVLQKDLLHAKGVLKKTKVALEESSSSLSAVEAENKTLKKLLAETHAVKNQEIEYWKVSFANLQDQNNMLFRQAESRENDYAREFVELEKMWVKRVERVTSELQEARGIKFQ